MLDSEYDFPADRLVQTPAERASLDALRDVSNEVNGQMEQHCVRQFRIAEKLGHDRGLEWDRELLCCVAFIHDAGLFPGASTGGVYTHDGRLLAERVLAPYEWSPERIALCLDAIEQHHSFQTRWYWGVEVELTRMSDQIDVLPQFVRYGISREWLAGLFKEMPRDGFYRHIWSQFWRGLHERPTTIPGMFRPPAAPTDPATL
jgi:hypothetical protein